METDVVIVGAGVIGLAVARAVAVAGHDVVVLEAADAIGTGISARNSEVIHAGLYYPPGSLKAELCVAGRRALYAFAESRGVTTRRFGKFVVATDDHEAARLEDILTNAQSNGVEDLSLIDANAVADAEPALAEAVVAALVSPVTGVVDSHGLMLALQGEAEDHGAMLAFETQFVSAEPNGNGRLRIAARSSQDPSGSPTELLHVTARWLINCAGLGAGNVAHAIAGMPVAHAPDVRLAKGHYFSLLGRAPVSRLIYPVPVPGGLGTHITLDLAGRARFGPDVQWIETEDYSVPQERADRFVADIRRYWPALPDNALQADYAGIRPKIVGPGEPAADFLIAGPETHGVEGFVNLQGIESPGLTSCLAVADATLSAMKQVA